MRTLAHVIQSTSANPETGLTDSSVAVSRQQFGENTLTALPREPVWKKFIEKFDEPIIKILLAATLLSMIVDLFKGDALVGGISVGAVAAILAGAYALRQGQWAPALMLLSAIGLFGVGLAGEHVLVEGLAVMIAVILATGVAFASEYKSDREFEVLNTQKESIKVKAFRAGQLLSLAVEDVVVGDVVLLETGDEIPADGRLLKANELMIDQSLMTGESEPVRKFTQPFDDAAEGPDQPGCVYRGTQVVDGVAHVMACEVGDRTSLGQIARRLSAGAGDDETDADDTEEARIKRKLTISKELTPLQLKLAHLANLISKVGYAAALLIFAAQVIRGLVVGDIFWPGDGDELLSVLTDLLGYFMTMVIIIVVAVPEGLPMSVTVSLALAMQKMTRANSLVRQLVACETIGSATVICTDKTGTLTQNRMQVTRISLGEQAWDRGTPEWPLPAPNASAEASPRTPIDWIALISAVNSTANLGDKQGKTITIGNSTEGALLQWLREAGIEYGELRVQTPALYQIHFSSERKRMTTVVRTGGQLFALVKGAPEAILDSCQNVLDADGVVQTLSDERKQSIQVRLREAAARTMRTLAFAYVPLPTETPDDEDGLHAMRPSLDQNLTYIGFVAIHDPLRDDVKAALAECRDAGIEVKMITGDNVEIARAIGHEIGLISRLEEPVDAPESVVLTSQRFNQMSDDELKGHLPRLRILARARPLDKFRMVKLLQELGEVVAVTGDGTNDAPALKKADVGLAMGIAGTEVAKEASKIVLLDDAFSTIVNAVHWGRSLYENIQRFIQFQLTINVSALAITFLGILLFNAKAPFTILQLLWINVIMDTFASIALCSGPPRSGIMKLKPKKRDESIVTPAMMTTIAITAAFFIAVMLTLQVAMDRGFFAAREGELSSVRRATLFFSFYVFFQVWNQINARSLTPTMSGFDGLARNPTFLTIAAVVAAGQIAIVTLGGPVFGVEPLSVLDWSLVIGLTSSVLALAEIARRIRSAIS